MLIYHNYMIPALTLRLSSKQIRFQIPPELLRVNRWIAQSQAVNSRLLVRQQKMHGSHRCCGWTMELTVDDVWQIAVLANGNFGVVQSSQWGTLEHDAQDNNGLSQRLVLYLHSPSNSQPVQVIMHQLWQTTLVAPGPCNQTCCSFMNRLQLVCDLRQCGRQNQVTIVDAWCDKSLN